MRHNLEHIISFHGPGKIKNAIATVGIVYFLSIGKDKAFTGSQTPNEGNIVFFPTAVGTSLTSCQSFRIRKPKSPVAPMDQKNTIVLESARPSVDD